MGKILIVDDDPGLRTVIARLLTEAGHETATAADLQTAKTLVETSVFNLVYCDVRLRNECGLELLSQIQPLPNQPLIIMMTGYPSLDTAQKALRNGAFDYLVKPILEDDLLRSVNRALSAKRFQEEKEHLRLHLEAVLNSVEEGLISVSQSLSLMSINRTAERLCGFRQEHLNRPVIEIINFFSCQAKCITTLLKSFNEGITLSVPRLVCRRQDMEEMVVTLMASPLRDGQEQTLGAVMAVKDVTRLDRLEKNLQQRPRFHRLVGQSTSMQNIYRLIENLAEVESTVLITGESGTGKELVAEAIHREGDRVAQPLIKVNCVALNETLLESELFGHVRGAFTGAIRDRIGRFQEAHRGTLFLDEIGDISPTMQVKLLRFLQEKRFERVGENRSHEVDVRIIAATNKNLHELVAQHRFREDLYYRLKVIELQLPPLRNHKEDISLLIEHCIADFNLRFGRTVPGITPAAQAALMRHDWPGNIRELQHAIEHAFVLCRHTAIDLDHLPATLHQEPPPMETKKPTSEEAMDPEKAAILQALSESKWNRDKAAHQLGMSRSTFYRRLRQLAIDRT
ncbi:MAG: sigma 54-interacting transcriptional regulator [Magnetococcus sp. YQC-5]